MRQVDAALMARLSGDATLVALATGGVHRLVAPIRVLTPHVVFGKQSGVPSYTHTLTASREMLYLVKAVAPGLSSDISGQIDERCRTLLQDHALVVSGFTTLYLRWDSDVDYIEEYQGETWTHEGALYRLEIT